MTSPQDLEKLFFEAAESDRQELLDSLLSALSGHGDLSTADIPEHISLLLENWSDSVENSLPKSLFCYRLCELNPPDSPQLRNILFKSLKKTLTSDFPRNSAAAALGLKDLSVKIHEISIRFKKLRVISNGQYFFSEKENKWGNIVSSDPLTGELSVKEVSGIGKTYSVTLQKVLSEFLLFSADSEMFKKISSKKSLSGIGRSEWIVAVKAFSLNQLTDAQLDKIAFFTILPDIMTLDQFNVWWKNTGAATSDPIEKGIASARNIKELHGTLLKLREKSLKIHAATDDEKKKIGECLSKVKDEPSLKEQILFAETAAILCDLGFRAELIGEILRVAKVKVPFWPQEPMINNTSLESLKLWDEISCEHIPALLDVTSKLYSGKYLSALMLHLPFRAINASPASFLDFETMKNVDPLSSDMLMYIWKNRNNVPEDILAKFNFRNIFHSISTVQHSWPDSKKELKKQLIENQVLQKYLLERHAENKEEIFEGIKMNKALSQQEIQSLLVRMSRLSPEFKVFLEKNQGRGAVNLQKPDKSTEAPPIPVTSMKSYGARVKEFEDIINKHLPENTASIAHARGYGDLRENAEYSAAKERQRFLNRRKAELELDLANVIPCNFEKLETPGYVQISTSVLLDTDGHRETYHIVGLWDSEPDKNMLSSDSRFSKALVSKKTGESVLLPDGKTAQILSISPLPEDMIKDLNNEHRHN